MHEDSEILSIDTGFYAGFYPDLQGLDSDALVRHYHLFGEAEGRIAAAYATRQGLCDALSEHDAILEIGPFTSPLVRGPRVKYFDVLDKAALIERARQHDRDTHLAKDIDYVSPNGDLSIIQDEKFDVVISSHCIEHQTDLIKHFRQVADILHPGGYYFLIIPDKRFCFDHYLPESSLADAVQAYVEERSAHSLGSVLEHKLLTTHNNSVRHWAGDHGQPDALQDPAALGRVIQEFKDAAGAYIDVHGWQFTPRSFRTLLQQLGKAGLTRLSPLHVFGTPRYSLEFCAILQKT
jgi:SAM-dependent methyltransferase